MNGLFGDIPPKYQSSIKALLKEKSVHLKPICEVLRHSCELAPSDRVICNLHITICGPESYSNTLVALFEDKEIWLQDPRDYIVPNVLYNNPHRLSSCDDDGEEQTVRHLVSHQKPLVQSLKFRTFCVDKGTVNSVNELIRDKRIYNRFVDMAMEIDSDVRSLVAINDHMCPSCRTSLESLDVEWRCGSTV